MKGENIPSIMISVFILIVLVIPYLLSILHSEPYPAIILPSGHSKINILDKEVENNEHEINLYKDGIASIVPIGVLLKGIPIQYYKSILKNELGFHGSNQNLTELRLFFEKNIGNSIDSISYKSYKTRRNVENGSLIEKELIMNRMYRFE